MQSGKIEVREKKHAHALRNAENYFDKLWLKDSVIEIENLG